VGVGVGVGVVVEVVEVEVEVCSRVSTLVNSEKENSSYGRFGAPIACAWSGR
jgi:hypothetical protein